MDLKERLSHNLQQTTDKQFHQSSKNDQSKKNDAFSKYERKPSTKIKTQNKNQNFDKYCRTGSAPKGQFKRYLMDTKNIFYEDREQKHSLERYKALKNISIVLFALLLVSYYLISQIKPYSGVCPSNAICGVFVHCNVGYDLNEKINQCIVSERIIDQAENLCSQTIQKLAIQYGDRDCSKSEDTRQPTIRLEQIFEGVEGETASLVKEKGIAFLVNEENQKQFGFKFYGGQIKINKKLHSFGCKVDLFFHSNEFIIGIISFIVLIVAIGYIYLYMGNKTRAKKIYDEIRQRILKEKLVNISELKGELEGKFGEIDESLWELIDGLRTKDCDIAYLQDDFLYWKLL